MLLHIVRSSVYVNGLVKQSPKKVDPSSQLLHDELNMYSWSSNVIDLDNSNKNGTNTTSNTTDPSKNDSQNNTTNNPSKDENQTKTENKTTGNTTTTTKNDTVDDPPVKENQNKTENKTNQNDTVATNPSKNISENPNKTENDDFDDDDDQIPDDIEADVKHRRPPGVPRVVMLVGGLLLVILLIAFVARQIRRYKLKSAYERQSDENAGTELGSAGMPVNPKQGKPVYLIVKLNLIRI